MSQNIWRRFAFEILLILFNLILFFFVLRINASKKEIVHSDIYPTGNLTQLPNSATSEVIKTRILFTGDVMLGRNVMIQSQKVNDYNYPFLKTANVLRDTDLTVINLENPVIENCPYHDSGYTFCSPVQSLNGLKFAGIDIANLANNHTLNFRQSGLLETQIHLQENGIDYTDSQRLLLKNINGINFGFLGFDFVFKKGSEADKYREIISDSARKSDVLITNIHWGDEYQSVANKTQREIAQKFIDWGVDVIVGNHPHWPQNIEYMEGKPVFYSLGNFVFDQMWSEETKKGIVVMLVFSGKNVESQKILKTYIRNIGQPEFLTD